MPHVITPKPRISAGSRFLAAVGLLFGAWATPAAAGSPHRQSHVMAAAAPHDTLRAVSDTITWQEILRLWRRQRVRFRIAVSGTSA